MSTRVLGVDGAMHKAPAFALQDFISGQEYTLDSFKGKKVLLTFFRSAHASLLAILASAWAHFSSKRCLRGRMHASYTSFLILLEPWRAWTEEPVQLVLAHL